MPYYGQINYQEKVGNSNLTIAEIGCFVTADCNLAQDFGDNIDPATLNTFYEQNGCYAYDLTDKANDDITWGTVTRKFPNIVVDQIVNAGGWPQSNEAIVKFIYKSVQTGATTPHFCKVADWTKQTIVDSWDGVVKSPGIYGQPVAHATFKNTASAVAPAPQSVANADIVGSVNVAGLELSAAMKSDLAGGMSVVAFNAKYSKTAGFQPIATSRQLAPASAPVAAPAAVATVETLHLAPDNNPLHAYNPGGPYNPNNPADYKGMIVPSAFKAQGGLDYAIVASLGNGIYRINSQDYGQVDIWTTGSDVTVTGGGHGEGEAQSTGATLTTLPEPMDLVTNKEATFYNYETGAPGMVLPAGTPFKAVSKATNGDNVYFVDPSDVGTIGIKTVDLSPATDAPSAPSPDEEQVSVTTGPLSWQRTYSRNLGPVAYRANADLTVEDLAGEGRDVEVEEGQIVKVIGSFVYGGIKYYRPTSKNTGAWYAIPVTSLTNLSTAKTAEDTELDAIDTTLDDEKGVRQTAIKAAGTTDGFVKRFLNRNKKG